MSQHSNDSESEGRSQASSRASSRRNSLAEDVVEEHELEQEDEDSIFKLEMAQLDPAAAKRREEEQAQFYTPVDQHRAVSNLVFYSIMMFLFPLGVMFGSYHAIFIDYFGYDSSTASLYAGISAAVAVIITMICFVLTAYFEEVEAEKKKLEKKNE
ncbi:hypothetical protein L596_018957 [Steinernema carpocapsae]|uniref:Vacuolar ATPase assembly integral membrane protein VMA21 homolog n=1 Tax=Steinernema carpocapsae TaxID=34508 RepID=A0A4V6A275_STECR|nr:hypothetical protein L596_018957 [Steinernema carpocapsae]